MASQECQGAKRSDVQFVPYCWGRVICENANVRILIHDVFCKATTGKLCPSAQECAIATDLKRGSTNEYMNGRNTKQTSWMGERKGGWGPTKKQDYIWTGEEEADLHRSNAGTNSDGESK